MMKYLLTIISCLMAMAVNAQIGDAFKGVWPVTDRALIKSLNGEWQLKVVDKIGDHATPVPAADVPAPFRPFLTQYDTYLLRYADIAE